MTEPAKGTAYFPAIEKKYGRPVTHWQDLLRRGPLPGRCPTSRCDAPSASAAATVCSWSPGLSVRHVQVHPVEADLLGGSADEPQADLRVGAGQQDCSASSTGSRPGRPHKGTWCCRTSGGAYT